MSHLVNTGTATTSLRKFRALVLDGAGDDQPPTATLRELDVEQLPAEGKLVNVQYSSLNYKDGMIIRGVGRLVGSYPHVPGIDLVGTLADDPNTCVVLTGYRVGETRWGGFSTCARVPGEWLLPLPPTMSPRQAMAIGTAGLTAALAVGSLTRNGLDPSAGNVLVTGAGGGVGNIAIILLAALGYRVVASTGRAKLADHLRSLGAAEVIGRDDLVGGVSKPLEKERFAAAIDTVGGKALSAILPQLRYGGAVASCGLAGGSNFSTSVIPFLLRGVSLLGVDSVLASTQKRRAAWDLLARALPLDHLDRISKTVPLSEVAQHAETILQGQVAGRIVVDVAS